MRHRTLYLVGTNYHEEIDVHRMRLAFSFSVRPLFDAKSVKFQVNFNGINNEFVDNENYENDGGGDNEQRIGVVRVCVKRFQKQFKRGK